MSDAITLQGVCPDRRQPIHPTVNAHFLIDHSAAGFRWVAREGGQSSEGHATLAACEKSALKHLESLPEFWAI